MKRFLLLPALLCFVCSLCSFASAKPTEAEQPPLDLPKLLTVTDSLIVYEGIPRNYPGSKDPAQEKLRPEPTFTVDSQTFYRKPAALTGEDRAVLETIFRSETPVKTYNGPKFCGGFHANFMIEWRRNNAPALRALVCFGCHEIRFVDGINIIETDMTEQGHQRLNDVLKKYRPAQTSSPSKPSATTPESSASPKRE